MDNNCIMDALEAPVSGIYHIPGEPAIIIYGLPPLPPTNAAVSAGDHVPGDTKPCVNTTGFCEWLVGREVVKPFGGQLYSGKVTEFDKEMGWYRVIYDDGDSEDLEWSELEQVLRPLDIMIPLKSIAAKIIKRQQKYVQKPTKIGS